MKFNKYTLKIENNKKTILYNLITKTLIEVDYNLENCTVENIIQDIGDEMLIFFKERLLISDDYNDDFKEFLYLKDKYNSSEIGRFVIHLGYRCNLSCSYCYQTTISECQKKTSYRCKKSCKFHYKSYYKRTL